MKPIPVLTVIGYSNAGKTRCVSMLVKELTRRGYRIAAAKHCHRGFELDHKGKDSWKHKQAGAVVTIMSSRNQVAMIRDLAESPSLQQLSQQYAGGVDLLIAEGYSWEPYPKILVMSKNSLEEERVPSPQMLIAVINDQPTRTELPQFTFLQAGLLANLVENLYLDQGNSELLILEA
jgi:molybdopterin-guanine dinucleotide biosynthesis adapter protein